MRAFITTILTGLLYLTMQPVFSVIRLAPLPTINSQSILKQYEPMARYLSSAIGEKIEIAYYADYRQVVTALRDGEVQLAVLGPVPYVMARREQRAIIPLVRFLESNGEEEYTCTLFVREKSTVREAGLIKNLDISLPQKLSTCGYFGAEEILRSYSLSVKQNRFSYAGSHSNVVLSILLGESDAGVVKTSIFRQYIHHGLVPLAETKPFPGFALASLEHGLLGAQKEKIIRALTVLNPRTNLRDKKLMASWSAELRNGAIRANPEDYAPMEAAVLALGEIE